MRSRSSVALVGGCLLALAACEGEASRRDPTAALARAESRTASTAARAEARTDAAPDHDASAPGAPRPESAGAVPSRFLGADESAIRASLRTSPLASATKGRGGRSLGFKVTLEDGTRGYFKPAQTFSAAHWYSEVAAYYLDRELGLGRVPPAVGRRFAWDRLRAVAAGDPRVGEVEPDADGQVRGALLYWVPEGLEPLPLGRGWEAWVRLEGGLGRSPYLRPSEVRAGVASNGEPAAGAPDTNDRAAELSDLLVFDYLIQNVDRWGGDNTNVRTRGRGGPLVFLDNGAGFWPNDRLPLMEARLRPVQRFRRATVEALRRFDLARFRAHLEADALAPVLDARKLEGLRIRIEAVLAHVEAVRARFGDAIWL